MSEVYMKFSILIANYNNGKYFKDCYDSIISQTYTNWEAIIVDDKSTDDSIQIIQELVENDSRFKLYKNEINCGCGYTKKRCTELAEGEVLGFIDPDDAITENAVELMVNTHKSNPNVVLVHSKLVYCDERLNQGTSYEFAKQVEVNKYFTNLDYAVTAFSSFKKTKFSNCEGIDPFLLRAVDQDLYLKLSEIGSFLYLNEPLYKYRIHENGIASTKGSMALYQHLKAIISAELRRGVKLEKEVAPYLSGKSFFLYEAYLNNPRYLIGKLFSLIKNNFINTIKKMITKS